MNKEVKELIDIMKEYADGFTSVLAPTEESVKALLDYINQIETSIVTKDSELLQLKEELRQLKTNRDNAIRFMKKCSFIEQHIEDVMEILERGTNEDDCSFDNPILGIPTFLDKMQELERGKE